MFKSCTDPVILLKHHKIIIEKFEKITDVTDLNSTLSKYGKTPLDQVSTDPKSFIKNMEEEMLDAYDKVLMRLFHLNSVNIVGNLYHRVSPFIFQGGYGHSIRFEGLDMHHAVVSSANYIKCKPTFEEEISLLITKSDYYLCQNAEKERWGN